MLGHNLKTIHDLLLTVLARNLKQFTIHRFITYDLLPPIEAKRYA